MRPDDGGGDGPDDPGVDGSDEPMSGSLPDPSLRHWRHPSELARERALPHPDPIPVPSGPPPGSPSTLWPVMVAGGFLAVAALGVLTMQSGRVATEALDTQTSSDQAIGLIDRNETSPSLPTTAESWNEETSSTITSFPSTTTVSDDDEGAEAARTHDSAEQPVRPPVASLTSAAELVESGPAYGVYDIDGPDGVPVASFTVIGDEVVTSAAAVASRDLVLVRIESDLVEARVGAIDPLTDLALLDLVEAPTGLALPALETSTETIGVNDLVMVGYGDPEWVSEEAVSADDRPVDQLVTVTSPPTGDPTTVEVPTLEAEARAWLNSSPYRGVVFSIDEPEVPIGDRAVFGPIWAAIDLRREDAGGPLRDRQGRVVGVVVLAKAQVAAVPIDRVADVVGSLRQLGVGDAIRLGVGLVDQNGKATVATVEPDGPLAGLRPGDAIVRFHDQPVTHPDEVHYLARELGPGTPVTVEVERRRRRWAVETQIGLGDGP